MMDVWPHLLRPFWLLILPLPLWLLWHLWHRQRQQGSWQRLLPVAFHDTLLTGGRVRNSRLPWLALGGAWLLTWLALLGPSWQQLEQPSLKRAAPLVVLLEMTPAMLAGDLQPTRLEHARHKVLDLLRLRQDAQTAVVVFAGSAHTLVPLSDDLATTENLLDAIRPELMPEEGHRANLAVAQALALLEQGAQGRGQLLLIGSTLAAEEQAGIASLLAGSGWRLSILGIGTEQGAPIAQQGGGFLKDPQGAILIPQLDAKGLQRFANELGGRYQSASLDDADLLALGLHETGNAATQASEATQLSVWLDQGHWLLLPLLVLAACAARRGWLFCLRCCCWFHRRPRRSSSMISGCAPISRASACWKHSVRPTPRSASRIPAGRVSPTIRPATTPLPRSCSPKAIARPIITIVAMRWSTATNWRTPSKPTIRRWNCSRISTLHDRTGPSPRRYCGNAKRNRTMKLSRRLKRDPNPSRATPPPRPPLPTPVPHRASRRKVKASSQNRMRRPLQRWNLSPAKTRAFRLHLSRYQPSPSSSRPPTNG